MPSLRSMASSGSLKLKQAATDVRHRTSSISSLHNPFASSDAPPVPPLPPSMTPSTSASTLRTRSTSAPQNGSTPNLAMTASDAPAPAAASSSRISRVSSTTRSPSTPPQHRIDDPTHASFSHAVDPHATVRPTRRTSARAVSEVNETVYSFRLLEALRKGDRSELHPFLTKSAARTGPTKELTSPLHLAVRCAEYPTIEYCLEYKSASLNAADTLNGNTPLHLASSLGRADVVRLFLQQEDVDDTVRNSEGKEAIDVAKTMEVAQIFQVSRAELNLQYLEALERWEKGLAGSEAVEQFLNRPRVRAIDLNAQTRGSGTTILHEAVRRKDARVVEISVRKGADVFCRNRKGRRALESTKDEKIKALLQQLSNADAARAVQSTAAGLPPIFRGYLAKWTNIAGGYKTRWFVLENGILSYYHTQEEEGKQSRGSTNLRFAKIHADGNDKHRFEVISDASKGSASKLYLRGSHPVERARWVQVLQQTVDFFDIDRAPSRAESIVSTRAPSRGSLLDATSTSHVPAGTQAVGAPSSIPSRTGTPFRGMAGLGATPSIPETSAAPTLVAPVPTRASALLDSGSQRASSMNSESRPFPLGRTPSFGSQNSRLPSDDGVFEDDESGDAAENPRGLPYQTEVTTIANSLRTQVDMAQQLAQSLTSGADAASASPKLPSTANVAGNRASISSVRLNYQSGPEGVRDALNDALSNSATLLARYQEIVSQREAYLLRRYEQEIQAKHLWEENMKVLGAQHAEMEAQLRQAAEENARKRRALKEVRDTIASSPSGTLASPHAGRDAASPLPSGFFSPGDSIAARRASGQTGAAQPHFDEALPSAIGGIQGTVAAIAGAELLASEQDNADDMDDEFFDAIDNNNLPGLKVEAPLAEEKKIGEKPAWPQDFDKERIDEESYEPYKRMRTKLPIGADERPSVSLWAVLKNNIGKDLTKISFPVAFNEPTSMLQRMAEDLEFPECLEAAATSPDSMKRIAFVAAFAASNYSSTIGRIAKPFNPILGETYEYCSLGKQPYRYVSEQVSHHPPKSACLAQAPLWEYMGSVDAKSKFTGRSFEIQPTGIAHVNLKVPRDFVKNAKKELQPAAGVKSDRVLEHYSWSKVTTVVSGFLTGSVSIDHVGTLAVQNHATKERCELTFRPRGWRGANACEIKGSVFDAKGNVTWDIAGRWSSQLVARRRGAGHGDLNPDEDVSASTAEYILLWRNNPKPPAAFNLTKFAATLNSLPTGLELWLPPTDCRLRPDLSAFESGRFSEADVLKGQLEEVQRATRRKREAGELPAHKARWFREVTDPDTNEPMWEALRVPDAATGEAEPEYWATRAQVGKEHKAGNTKVEWPGTSHIFGGLESSRARP